MTQKEKREQKQPASPVSSTVEVCLNDSKGEERTETYHSEILGSGCRCLNDSKGEERTETSYISTLHASIFIRLNDSKGEERTETSRLYAYL